MTVMNSELSIKRYFEQNFLKRFAISAPLPPMLESGKKHRGDAGGIV